MHGGRLLPPSARPARPARRAPVGRHPEPDSPRALADVQLAEAARAELGDQGGQELVGEAVDRGVIRPALLGRALRHPGVVRAGVLGHASDLLSRRGLVAALAYAEIADAGPHRLEGPAEPVRQAGPLGRLGDLGAAEIVERAEVPVAAQRGRPRARRWASRPGGRAAPR